MTPTPAEYTVFFNMIKAASERSPEEVRKIVDLWDSTVQSLSEKEVKIGPVVASSGEGAPAMIRTYSDVAPQHGTEKLYEEFAKLLEEHKAVKAALEALVAKAEAKEEEKEEEKKAEEAKKAESEKKEERKNPGDFGEEYKDSERAAKAFAHTVVKELAALLKGEPEGFEKEEKVHEKNSNQAARPEAHKANSDHGPDGKFDTKAGSEHKEEKEEEKTEKSEVAELRDLVKSLVERVNVATEAQKSSLTGAEVSAPVLGGRAAAPINTAAIDGITSKGSHAQSIVMKATADFTKGLLPEAVKQEIDSLVVLARHVEGNIAPKQAFDQQLKLASPMARAYFS